MRGDKLITVMFLLSISVLFLSTVNVTRYNAPDAFFLRPHLTREEYAYWNNHLSRLSPSCACSCARASNPKDNTIVTYYHTEPSVCVQNVTVLPHKTPAFRNGPVVRGKSASEGFHRNTGFAPKRPVHEKVVSIASCGGMKADALVYHSSKNTSSNMGNIGECISKDKGFIGTPSSRERSIAILRQTGRSSPKRSPNRRDSTNGHGVHQVLSPESRRRISERYLCGDKSFEEIPSAPASTTRHENVKTGLCDSTRTFGARSGSVDSRPVKRKSTSVSEHEEGNCKRQCLGDDELRMNEAEAPNETIDLNDTLKSFLDGPHSRDNCPGNNESFNIDGSRGMQRSRRVNWSRGMAGACVQGRCAAEDINSDDRCEIIGVNEADYESVSKTITINQPKTALTDGLADVAVKSRSGDKALNYGNKPSERKVSGDVINTAKPVQRKLLKNTKSSLCGSYALDYESLPKLISVLSSSMAKVVSSLTP